MARRAAPYIVLYLSFLSLSAPGQAEPAAEASKGAVPTAPQPGTASPVQADPAKSSPAATAKQPDLAPAGKVDLAKPATGKAPAKAAPAPTIALSEVSPGPFDTDRKHLRAWLVAAQGRGVGVSTYAKAYESLEASVRSGAPQDKVKPQLDAILKAINEQVKSSVVYKTTRPVRSMAGRKKFNILKDQFDPVWQGPDVSSGYVTKINDDAYNTALMKLPPELRRDPDIISDLRKRRDKEKARNMEKFNQGNYRF